MAGKAGEWKGAEWIMMGNWERNTLRKWGYHKDGRNKHTIEEKSSGLALDI